MSFLNNLTWRFATKEFDINKKISKKDLEKILHSIRMAPTSMGLQSFKIFIISDQKLKKKLTPIAKNQKQINSCNYLLIFCSDTNIEKNINTYIEASAKTNPISNKKITHLKESRKKYIANKSSDELLIWINQQIYIALGFAMAACAELHIDSCPIGGFEKSQMDKILKLPNNLKSQVLLPIGYRQEEPQIKKVRISNENLFTNL